MNPATGMPNEASAYHARHAILVVGMHRSGTSAITRTLNILGATLPGNLMPPQKDNPAGFWESADLMRIHDDFLGAVSSTWDDPLPLPDAVFQTHAATVCHDEILTILHRDFADSACFVIKDPRICRLLPLWNKVLATFNALPSAVLPLRNPLETAMSLRLRNGTTRRHAFAQWLVHTTMAEQGTRGWKRCFVDYDACLADPAGQVSRLARILGCFTSERPIVALPEIEEFWSDTLRHHRIAPPHPADESLPAWVRRGYAWVAQATRHDDVDPTPIIALGREIAEAIEVYGPFVRATAELEHAVATRTDEIATLHAALSEAAAATETVTAENARLVHEHRQLTGENQRVTGLTQLAAQENLALTREVAQLADNLGHAREQQREQSARLARASEECLATHTECTRLTIALGEADTHLATLREALDNTRREQARLASASEQMGKDLETFRAERDALQAELACRQATLTSTIETLDAVQAERDRLQAALLQTNLIHSQSRAQFQSRFQTGQDVLRTALTTLTEQSRHHDMALTALTAIVTETLGEIPLGRRVGGLVRAAWKGRLRQRLREDADIRIIARTGVFDPTYYLNRYPDVGTDQADPLVHYVRCGASEGRTPNPLFDSRYYWNTYPDVARAGANPLAHYVRFGAREGRRTHATQNGESPAPGIFALLASRFAGNAAPLPAMEDSRARQDPAEPILPTGTFGWLAESDRRSLAGLLADYGLADRNAPPPGWDAERAVAQVARILADLPHGPIVLSIVIPVYNQLRHTLACLESLARWAPAQPVEILIGDDASTDGSEHLLPTLPHVRVFRNGQALGFLDNCNSTAAHARGRYLLVLNNDTVILPDALEALLQTFIRHPDCGLAGCRLLYPDGRLQEAGGVIWADGSGWNFGRGDNPEKAEYSHLREADYCSGAAISLPTNIWRRLGGFDARYRPAYYEDTDLAFRVREAGLRVIYQPDACVIHCEGVSNGTSEDAGVKSHQRENRPVFAARWQTVLTAYGTPDARPENFAERTRRGRILVLDTTPPTPDQDSGSQDTQILLKLLRKQGWHVTFLPENLLNHTPYTATLRGEGIECPYYPLVEDFMSTAAYYAALSDAVIVSRQPLACKVVDMLKKAAPRAKLIFNTVDLHFLREERAAALFNDPQTSCRAAEIRKAELASIRTVDATLVVSTYEADMLAHLTPAARVRVVPVRRETPALPCTAFGQRNGVLFIGGFRHPPNQDAVRWLLSEIWPRARAGGLHAPLYIVGADAPSFLQDDPANDIHVMGHIPALDDAFAGVRLSVAPIRYGAGLKGKVIDSLLHGVPAVATPMAIEGSGLEHGRHLLRAESPEDFAAAIVRLHEDAALWQQLATNGLDTGRAMFSDDRADLTLRRLWADLGFTWCLSDNALH